MAYYGATDEMVHNTSSEVPNAADVIKICQYNTLIPKFLES